MITQYIFEEKNFCYSLQIFRTADTSKCHINECFKINDKQKTHIYIDTYIHT